jgi:hypothetical protein
VCEAKLLNVLLPHLAALRIEGLSHEKGMVCLRARADAVEAPCPACGMASAQVHSWYERRLADAPVAGQRVLIHLRVRRFICQTLDCARQIFCEQLGGLTVRHGRRSLHLVEVLVAIAFALAGRPAHGWPARRPSRSAGPPLLHVLLPQRYGKDTCRAERVNTGRLDSAVLDSVLRTLHDQRLLDESVEEYLARSRGRQAEHAGAGGGRAG